MAAAACLPDQRSLATTDRRVHMAGPVPRHEASREDHRYRNKDLLKEHKKEVPRHAA
jgi:hypothetical protein